MANRVAIGSRGTPTTLSSSTVTVQVVDFVYNQIGVGGGFAVTYAVIRLANTVSLSGSITLTMPNGDTYTTSNYTYSATGSIQTYTGGSSNPLLFAPYVKLNAYDETQYQSTPITIGTPESNGVFIGGLNTSSGSGTSSDPYGKANVLGVNDGTMENTTFDSGAHIGAGLQVFDYYQGTLSTSTSTKSITSTITHNWGTYTGQTSEPAYAFRWAPSAAYDSGTGKVTRVYPPWHQFNEANTGFFPNTTQELEYYRCWVSGNNTNSIDVQAMNRNIVIPSSGSTTDVGVAETFYWALVIFYEPNYLGGNSL